jgi:hypothetical protein
VTVSPGARPRVVEGTHWVQVEDEVVVHNAATRRVARLDRVGGIVWPFLDGTATIEELAADVADAFGQPVEEVLPALATLVESLVDADLVRVGPETAPGAPRPGFLVDPPGPCGGGGGRPDFAATRTIAVGGVKIGVRTVPELAEALDALVQPLLVEDDPDVTPNYSLQPARADRRFHVVVRYLCDAVRTRDPVRAVDGLVAHLGGHRPPEADHLRLGCTAVLLPDDRAVLLPNLVGVIGRVQRNLTEAGARLVDRPWADVDVAARELVVRDDDPGVDATARAALVDGLIALSGQEPRPEPVVAAGRYALAGWAIEAFLPEGVEALSPVEAIERASWYLPAVHDGAGGALPAVAELVAAVPPTVVPWDDRRALVTTLRAFQAGG